MALFTKLHASAPQALKKPAETYLQYAKAHYDIIDKFGHFPHRNEALGRETSDAEMAFLEEENSSF